LPGKTDLSRLNCSLAGALNLIGDWWTLLIVRDALLGATRFSEFQQSLGLARNILAARLHRLVAGGVLERHGSQRRPTYRLTAMGRALAPALAALTQWGDAWIAADGPPVVLTDPLGREVDPVSLTANGQPVAPADLRFRPGPAADPRTQAFLALVARRARAAEAPIETPRPPGVPPARTGGDGGRVRGGSVREGSAAGSTAGGGAGRTPPAGSGPARSPGRLRSAGAR
jgi:DNA-binding HxlR family transcriptional regulator